MIKMGGSPIKRKIKATKSCFFAKKQKNKGDFRCLARINFKCPVGNSRRRANYYIVTLAVSQRNYLKMTVSCWLLQNFRMLFAAVCCLPQQNRCKSDLLLYRKTSVDLFAASQTACPFRNTVYRSASCLMLLACCTNRLLRLAIYLRFAFFFAPTTQVISVYFRQHTSCITKPQ